MTCLPSSVSCQGRRVYLIRSSKKREFVSPSIPIPKRGTDLNGILLTSQFLNSERLDWDIHKLKLWFEDFIIDLILKIPISLVASVDRWVWTPSSSGVLLVKSSYWICKEEAHHNNDSLELYLESQFA